MPDILERPTIALHGIRTVAGRYVIGGQHMHPGVNLFGCRLRMISSDTFRVTAPVIPEIGEAITASFAPFGAIYGRIERQFEDGFVVSIVQNDEDRNRLNNRITVFSERLWTGNRDRRSDKRFMPRNPRTVLSRPDNWFQPCLVLDYSASGAAVSSAFQPSVGEVVCIGQVTAEVVRLFDVGFAVRFFEPQDIDALESLLEAPDEWTAMVRRNFPTPA